MTSIGSRHAREVADQVLQHLRELDLHARHRGQDASRTSNPLPASIVAVALLLEPHRNVAAIRFGQKKPQLGAGAAAKTPRPRASPSGSPSILPSSASVSCDRARRRRDVIEDETRPHRARADSRCRYTVKQECYEETRKRGDERQRRQPDERAQLGEKGGAHRAEDPSRRAARPPPAPDQLLERGGEVERERSEIASPPPSVIASERKNIPVTPETKTSGTNTTITVSVEAISGRLSSAERAR